MFVLLIYIILFPFTLNATNGDKPKLKFIGQGNEAPYFFTTSDNAPTGFTSELIDILMHDSDYEYSIETLSREDYRTFIRKINIKELVLNVNEIVINIPLANDKNEDYHYSYPYKSVDFEIVSRKSTKYESRNDLINKSILVRRWGNTYSKLREQDYLSCNNIIYVPDNYSGLKMLADG